MHVPEKTKEEIDNAQERVNAIRALYEDGIITDKERYQNTVNI